MLNNKKNDFIYTHVFFSKFLILKEMIDNLFFDPMKQIWINLELYFKRYKFLNF